MHILVLNPGSSSIKFSLFAGTTSSADPTTLLEGECTGIGSPHTQLAITSSSLPAVPQATHACSAATVSEALRHVFSALFTPDTPAIDAVGYRVVHPGSHIHAHLRVTPQVLRQLQDSANFAPLHDPVALQALHTGMERLPNIPHFACFDTIFHQTMPVEASIYPIPASFREAGVRRYGFHGLSCESVIRQLHRLGPIPPRMVIAHLGSGCSLTALRDGISIDTTMGLTPSGGVLMGTRPGDLDPGLVLYLLRQQTGADPASALEALLNQHSGMLALSDLPNNVQDLRAAAATDPQARLALNVFTRSITKAIGSFAFLLGGLDALVFTGGIGQHDPASRAEILAHLTRLGVILDTDINLHPPQPVAVLSTPGSRTAVFTVPAQEDLIIALHVLHLSQY